MCTAVATAVTDSIAIDVALVHADFLEICDDFITIIELADIYPRVIFSIKVICDNYGTWCNSRAVCTFPIGALLIWNVFLLYINLGCYTVIGNSAVIADTQPMRGIHRNRVVPAEAACTVAEVGKGIVDES